LLIQAAADDVASAAQKSGELLDGLQPVRSIDITKPSAAPTLEAQLLRAAIVDRAEPIKMVAFDEYRRNNDVVGGLRSGGRPAAEHMP
jgi:hypothetical protein